MTPNCILPDKLVTGLSNEMDAADETLEVQSSTRNSTFDILKSLDVVSDVIQNVSDIMKKIERKDSPKEEQGPIQHHINIESIYPNAVTRFETNMLGEPLVRLTQTEKQIFNQKIYQTVSKEIDIFISQNNNFFVLKYFVYKFIPFCRRGVFEEINLKIHRDNESCYFFSRRKQLVVEQQFCESTDQSDFVRRNQNDKDNCFQKDDLVISKSGCEDNDASINCVCRRYLKKLLKKMYFYEMLDEETLKLSIFIMKSFLKRYSMGYHLIDTFVILLVISLNISNKYLNDEPYLNRSYADLINLDIKIFNKLELIFLSTLDYTIERI